MSQFFLDAISVYDEATKEKIIAGMKNRHTTIRVNTLKATKEEVLSFFNQNGFIYEQAKIYENAYILLNKNENDIYNSSLFLDGKIYMQSLSSMLPPLVMDLKENTDILDMAAAPGGKTTLICALLNNKARITACEMNKIRASKLEYNIKGQGAKATVLNVDARRLDDYFSFDNILLDAPCSGSGTRFYNEESLSGFSSILVNKSVKSQEEMLKKAFKALKKGNTLVYSTCSILPIENDLLIKKALKGLNYEIVPISINDPNIEFLPNSLPGTLTICPNEYYEGFYVSKIKKC